MKILASPGVEIGELNPYTRLLYQPIRELGHTVDDFRFDRAFLRKYNVLHFHWPEYYVAHPSTRKAILGTLATLLAVRWARMRGAQIVWTAHNLESHHGPRPRMERWFWNRFTKSLDGFIAMTGCGRTETQRAFPCLKNIPSFVISHGNYRGEYAPTTDKRAARAVLNIPGDARVVCFFGMLSKYKGVSDLVSAFREMPDPKLVLLIAGANEDPDEAAFLKSQAREDERIKLHLNFVPKDQVQYYFGAADLVALPFRKIWNSGSAMLALSFDRPILVPARDVFIELQRQIGTEWIRTYQGELTALEVQGALAWALDTQRDASAPLERFGWPRIAEDTLRCYLNLLGNEGEQPIPIHPRRPSADEFAADGNRIIQE